MNRSMATTAPSLATGQNKQAKSPLLQRKCACGGAAQVTGQCEGCREKDLVQRRIANDSSRPSEAPPLVHEVLRSSGQRLEPAARAFFEPRFGHDFGRVRVHTDSEASRSATAVDALAYTVGEHIVFNAGRYDPVSMEGRRLLAHELAHVLQQSAGQRTASPGQLVDSQTTVQAVSAQSKLQVGEPDDQLEREADRIADRIVTGEPATSASPSSENATVTPAVIQPSVARRALLQRQPPPPTPPPTTPAGTCPNSVSFSTGNADVHVPLCGISSVTANTDPANIPGITWTITAGTAQVATGTTISNAGQITFDPAQTGGTVRVTATQPTPTGGGACRAFSDLTMNSHPSAISSTFVVGPLAATRTRYGAVFDHNFTSADGRAASMENVPVGEEFSGVPNPTATIHTITTPFGDFDLTTRNLTATATNNWFVTNGSLGGTHDSISIDRSMPKVGEFLRSASNPTPAATLPVGFTLTQGLFWFCRQAPAASAWTKIQDVDHVRTLQLDSAGTGVEFVVSVNGEKNVETYSGQPAIINASASPATIPPTPARVPRGPAPTPSTTQISADPRPDPMPSGHSLRFAIRGAALGCTVNATTGLFTAGTQTGTVTVRISDSARGNTNFDEVVVTIANPTPPTPAPGQPGPGQPGPGQPSPGPTPSPTPAPKTSSAEEGGGGTGLGVSKVFPNDPAASSRIESLRAVISQPSLSSLMAGEAIPPIEGAQFPRLSLPLPYEANLEDTETLGATICDVNKGGMSWRVDYDVTPTCMWACVEAHEKDHVEFRKSECAKVVAAHKVSAAAIAKAEKSLSKSDLDAAEKATKDFGKAVDAYLKNFADTCQASEQRAYGVGIAVCDTPAVRKECDQLGETKDYQEIMKDWKAFKTNAPNCPSAPVKQEKKSPASPKKSEKEKAARAARGGKR